MSYKTNFPKKSYKISGISFYQQNCKNITYKTELFMEQQFNNKYDKTAIMILDKNNNQIGYVPNNFKIKKRCLRYLLKKKQNTLKILNIKKINNIIGIRVIFKTKFKEKDVCKFILNNTEIL